MTKFKLATAAAAALLISTAGSAATYTGTFTVGQGTVDFSATTNGTIGVLDTNDFTGYSITLTNAGGTVNLNPGNSLNSYFMGTALSATATELIFDFSGDGLILVDDYDIGGQNAFCLDTLAAPRTCFDTPPSNIIVVNGAFSTQNRTGQFVLGSVASAAVPEPESWAMLILGFMAVGAGLRRRTAQRSLTASMA